MNSAIYYSEIYIIVLIGSYIIFSLSIKEDIREKLKEFKISIKRFYDKHKARIQNNPEELRKFKDFIESKVKLVETALERLITSIYHSFYLVFLISLLGTIFAFSVEYMELLSLTKGYLGVPFLFLLYFISRAVLLFACYNKIDTIRYLEHIKKLVVHVNENDYSKIEPKSISVIDDLKQVCYTIMFYIFVIFNKAFKELFYKFYDELSKPTYTSIEEEE